MSSYLKSLFFIILIGLTLSSYSSPQVVYWQRLGTFNYVFDVKTNSSGDIFVCIQSDYGIKRSTDGGITWETLDAVQHYISKIAINSSDEIFIASDWGGGIFKSTDNGETWINTNSGGGFYTALLISDEGYVYAGDDDGLFTYSYDNGNSWNYIPVTNVQINSIATCSNGQIFLGTEGQRIFTSTDYGVTWFQILNPNLSNYVNSIAISDSDYVYATNYDGISISTDYGETWIYQNTLYYTSDDCLAVDSVGNIFLGHTGVYKSKDNGISWVYLGGIHPYTIFLYEEKIFSAGPIGLYLYDPEYEPYIGSNYLPLNVGNRWQFLHRRTFEDLIYYSISETTINRDTIINNIPYYLWGQIYIRYSDTTKILYRFLNDSDRVFMDFNLIPGTQFLQYSNSGYRTVTVTESNESRFGFPYNVKGYSYSLYYNSDSRKFAENIGFYHSSSFMGGGVSSGYTANLISCLLYDTLGNPTYISEHYKPEFTITPVTSIDTSVFALSFIVDHHYSRFFQPGTPFGSLNFVDSVYMIRNYSNGDSVINLPIIIPDNNPPYINPSYSVNFSIDTSLLKNGFNFYYKFCAKDKAIIPEYACVPDSGYFECVWDFLNSVSNEAIVSFYSLEQNYPNPFNPKTIIEYSIAEAGLVEIEIIDLLGRKINTLVNEFQNSGKYQFTFDASELSSGIYFYRIKSGDFTETKKMLLLK